MTLPLLHALCVSVLESLHPRTAPGRCTTFCRSSSGVAGRERLLASASVGMRGQELEKVLSKLKPKASNEEAQFLFEEAQLLISAMKMPDGLKADISEAMTKAGAQQKEQPKEPRSLYVSALHPECARVSWSRCPEVSWRCVGVVKTRKHAQSRAFAMPRDPAHTKRIVVSHEV